MTTRSFIRKQKQLMEQKKKELENKRKELENKRKELENKRKELENKRKELENKKSTLGEKNGNEQNNKHKNKSESNKEERKTENDEMMKKKKALVIRDLQTQCIDMTNFVSAEVFDQSQTLEFLKGVLPVGAPVANKRHCFHYETLYNIFMS
jgi:chromosome segregation ATPase